MGILGCLVERHGRPAACGYPIYELLLHAYLLIGAWFVTAFTVYVLDSRRNSRLELTTVINAERAGV
ncbi:hypothetical protein [Streptomyces sp. NPDC002851]